MSGRDFPDYFLIRPDHKAVDIELQNWARTVRDNVHGSRCAPMFRQYRSSEVWVVHEPQIPIRLLDGYDMEKAVSALPEKEKEAVRWHYVKTKIKPWTIARQLGVNQSVLGELVHRARAMLSNRARRSTKPLDRTF